MKVNPISTAFATASILANGLSIYRSRVLVVCLACAMPHCMLNTQTSTGKLILVDQADADIRIVDHEAGA